MCMCDGAMNREGGWSSFYYSYVLILMDIIINQFSIKGYIDEGTNLKRDNLTSISR